MTAASIAIWLRPATQVDLAAINAVIERAVMTWQLPERVKRLTLPSYRYSAHDLEHLHIVIAEDAERTVLGRPRHPARGDRGEVNAYLRSHRQRPASRAFVVSALVTSPARVRSARSRVSPRHEAVN